MEPISAIALSLALGAGAVAGKELVSGLVKDGYAKIKKMIETRYPHISVDQLERSPKSMSRRQVIEEELTQVGANQDIELMAVARDLIELIRKESPNVAEAIGVDLKDIEGANLRLADIVASGTGVRLEKGRFTGDVEISGVRGGSQPISRAAAEPYTPLPAPPIGAQFNNSVIHGNVSFFAEALSHVDSSLEELCTLLHYRAEKVKHRLNSGEAAEFERLHMRHVGALQNGDLVLAHEILSDIRELIANHGPKISYFIAPPRSERINYAEEYFEGDLIGGIEAVLGFLTGSSTGIRKGSGSSVREIIDSYVKLTVCIKIGG